MFYNNKDSLLTERILSKALFDYALIFEKIFPRAVQGRCCYRDARDEVAKSETWSMSRLLSGEAETESVMAPLKAALSRVALGLTVSVSPGVL